jgi:Polyketide cyclase / dehydrase and lipid transport
MAQTVTVSRHIRCPVDEASAFVTDPHSVLSKVSTFSRCRFIESHDDGELWDVYLDSGTVHLGGRVLITPPDDGRLQWRSVRGTRHSFTALVEPDGEGSRLTMCLRFSVSGFGIAFISELIGRGLVGRNLEAIAEEIRHHLEFEK